MLDSKVVAKLEDNFIAVLAKMPEQQRSSVLKTMKDDMNNPQEWGLFVSKLPFKVVEEDVDAATPATPDELLKLTHESGVMEAIGAMASGKEVTVNDIPSQVSGFDKPTGGINLKWVTAGAAAVTATAGVVANPSVVAGISGVAGVATGYLAGEWLDNKLNGSSHLVRYSVAVALGGAVGGAFSIGGGLVGNMIAAKGESTTNSNEGDVGDVVGETNYIF